MCDCCFFSVRRIWSTLDSSAGWDLASHKYCYDPCSWHVQLVQIWLGHSESPKKVPSKPNPSKICPKNWLNYAKLQLGLSLAARKGGQRGQRWRRICCGAAICYTLGKEVMTQPVTSLSVRGFAMIFSELQYTYLILMVIYRSCHSYLKLPELP